MLAAGTVWCLRGCCSACRCVRSAPWHLCALSRRVRQAARLNVPLPEHVVLPLELPDPRLKLRSLLQHALLELHLGRAQVDVEVHEPLHFHFKRHLFGHRPLGAAEGLLQLARQPIPLAHNIAQLLSQAVQVAALLAASVRFAGLELGLELGDPFPKALHALLLRLQPVLSKIAAALKPLVGLCQRFDIGVEVGDLVPELLLA
mmetsp:Transcript_4199/g.10113  ORF Transcript_4199/g.10113 Transcript_4199/m.10113 type:complete len:203 (-) Transcript_4199:1400-2008(-)